jgi:hypothetical protein
MLDIMPDVRPGTTPDPVPDTVPGSPPQETHRYDVCFFLNRRRALHWLDHGVTLGGGGVSHTGDGELGAESFNSIVAVHLKTCGQRSNIESCAITFANNNVLTILSCNPGGYADTARAENYRAFVHDLHARLAAAAPGAIRFTEGWPLWQCQAALALTALVALSASALGLYVFACLGNIRGLLLVALAAFGCWKFYRTALNNVPRDYTPDRLPEFLLS